MDTQLNLNLILDPAACVREEICLQERIAESARYQLLPAEEVLRQRLVEPAIIPAAPLFVP